MVGTFILVLAFTSLTSGKLLNVWIKTPYIRVGTVSSDIINYVKASRNYGYNPTAKDYIIFKVMASNDATVFLFPSQTMTPSDSYYMVQLRGFGLCEISHRDTRDSPKVVLVSSSQPNLLHSKEYRPFWISWKNGFIQVGKGNTTMNNSFLDWNDTSFNSLDLGVSTVYQAEGSWIVEVQEHFAGYFSACNKTNIRGDMTLIISSTVENKIVCASKCSMLGDCLGFNYQNVDQLCELISHEQFIVETVVAGWMFYRKCLQEHTGCICGVQLVIP